MNHFALSVLCSKVSNFEFKSGLTSFLNPYSMSLLKDDIEIANNIDNWHVDGISLVKILNKFLNINIIRFSFDDTSLAPIIFNYAKSNNLKLAVVGTHEDTIHKAVDNIEAKYNIKIHYYRNGYFIDNNDMYNCFNDILSKNIDLLVCGMGTPHQEKFLIKLRKLGWNGYGFTCGGYLHQVSKKKDYYPRFFNEFNIRWMYRIFDEPLLLKRYCILYPLFFIVLFKHLILKSLVSK